jgi:hypothetical protein
MSPRKKINGYTFQDVCGDLEKYASHVDSLLARRRMEGTASLPSNPLSFLPG